MTYKQAVDFINSSLKFGAKLSLDRIAGLLESMGNPEKKLKFVHIAGTNGKGSTAAMTASVLHEAGYKTGLFISPYVNDFRERIQIDGKMIEKEELSKTVYELMPVFKAYGEGGGEKPTEFEIITAIALYHFAKHKCGIVVLEVGLGGRFDATNVIDVPEVAAITSISFDHTEYLGDTLDKIAFEKCGIIKPGCETVTYAMQPESAECVIENICRKNNARLNVPDLKKLKILKESIEGSEIVYNGLKLNIPLLGEHQILNALTVLEIVAALKRRGFAISDEAIIRGVKSTRFAGRLEIIRTKPLVIIDGAHNRGGIEMLCRAIDSLLQGRRIITIMGMLADKEYEYCIPQMAKRSDVFFAVRPDSPRALDTFKALNIAKEFCEKASACDSIEKAYKDAMSEATDNDVILGCGSLYMIGSLKKLF